ncbi:MAG TPA: 4-hydroxythreonine-4-phosphate dehydrogenase PdxA, partial [Steroidobacteraceae bacterium]
MLAVRARRLRLPMTFSDYRAGSEIQYAAGSLTVLHMPLATECVPGRLELKNARSVLTLIDRAVDGCLAGEFAALVTAPVQKSLINQAGVAFSGHTEYIAQRTHAPLPVMLLVADELRVALATTHLPLRAVSDALSTDALLQLMHVLS